MGNGKYQAGNRSAQLALYLSALVFPGVGQFAQKRWLMGVFYAAAFLAGVIFLFMAILVPLYWNLRMLAEYSEKEQALVFCPIPYVKIMVWLGISALVYLGSLLDTFVYYRRSQGRRLEAGLPEKDAEKAGED